MRRDGIWENWSRSSRISSIQSIDGFFFKEGFSRDFVLMTFDEFRVDEGWRILDPFVGSGTTLLAAKEYGVDAVGVDAAPLAVFVSQVKTADYDLDELIRLGIGFYPARSGNMISQMLADSLRDSSSSLP